ncbi:MAG: hypothetical protein HY901_30660 [Deltaproteobacteria bacterium]|nr:hypothetical protein [Deltaproteobacteria bacterium]
MLTPLLVLAGLSLGQLPQQAAVKAPELRWHTSRFHSLAFAIDGMSPPNANPRLKSLWAKSHALGDQEERLLSQYSSIRKRVVALEPHGTSDDAEKIAAPGADTLLPPENKGGNEPFLLKLLLSSDLDGALKAFGATLSGEEAESLRQVFTHFDRQLDDIWKNGALLEECRKKLETLAARSSIAGFLQSLARFYGVEEILLEPLEVELLWGSSFRGTVMGRRMILFFPPDTKTDEGTMASKLGVVVHELGHYFEERMPVERKRAITTAMVEKAGYVNDGHPNILEEALQTAAGNIVFLKKHFPAAYDPNASFYMYEAKLEYPFAIDALARRLAPILEKELEASSTFFPRFLDLALAEQRQVIPPLPRHFARASLVSGPAKQVAMLFKPLFGETHVSLDLSHPEAAGSTVSQCPSRSVVLLGLEGDLPALRKILEQSGEKGVSIPDTLGDEPMLVVQPRAAGGYLMVAAGKQESQLREALIRLFMLPSFPPPSAPAIVLSGRPSIGAHLVGKRVELLAKTTTAGQYLVAPPPAHPVVTHVLVGDYKMPVYSREALPAQMQRCALRVTGLLAGEQGPVKDGSRSGRTYEPRVQYSVTVERWECAQPSR